MYQKKGTQGVDGTLPEGTIFKCGNRSLPQGARIANLSPPPVPWSLNSPLSPSALHNPRPLDPVHNSCYCEKVRKNAFSRVSQGRNEVGQPGETDSSRLVPGAGTTCSPKQVPVLALFLRRAGANRIGARAFSALEGYASRKRRYGAGFTAFCCG